MDPSAPDLQFGPGELAGFTSSGVAGFQNLNPAAVVRELLQNSLDAAREAGRDVARVRFEVKEHPLGDVPGIDAYRRAFGCALRDHRSRQPGGLPSQTEVVTRTIKSCLKAWSCRSLFVLDNGIGLDDRSMGSVLADGLSVKGESGAGAFGNGHFVVMPASDLRYVLYGGRTGPGSIIGSGHAILASHNNDAGENGPEPCGKDGYFISGFTDDLFDRFHFASGAAVPAYLRRKLDWIADAWSPGTGAVVAVPGFNNFRENKHKWWEEVVKAAACNFFPAVHDGKLSVQTADDGDERTLDADTVTSILKSFRDEKRSKFLSGSRAWAAFETITEGKALAVETDAGAVPIRLRQAPDDGVTRIDLCRNGMWITNEIPKLKPSRFTDRKPFHCVLLLDPAEGAQIHGLVRKAEGPLHNHLEAKKWLTADERRGLETALERVAEAISAHVPELDGDIARISDILVVNTPGILPGDTRAAVAGRFVTVPPPVQRDGVGEEEDAPDPDSWPHDPTQKKTWKQTRAKPGGRPVRFRALAEPTASRSVRVTLRPDEDCPAGEIRFALDESVDESCDHPGGETWVTITRVTLDGEPVSDAALTGRDDEGGRGVMLGSLVSGVDRCIEFEFALPENVRIRGNAPVVLKTQIFRRARPVSEKTDDDA